LRGPARGRRRLVLGLARGIARDRWGVGIRENHRRQDDRRTRATHRRHHSRLRTGSIEPRPVNRRAATPGPRGADRVSRPLHEPGPAADGRAGAGRGPSIAPRMGSRAAPPARPGAGGARGLGRAANPRATALALRRPAPARGDRPSPCRGAEGPDPRRVCGVARRLDPGPGAEPACGHPGRDRHLIRRHQSRPRRRPPAHGGDGGHVARPYRRARAHAAGARSARTRLHEAAPGERAPSGMEAKAAQHGGFRSEGGVMDELCYLSATEALRLFRARELSPVELVQAVIDRAAKVEPVINAFAETRYEEALAKARDAEARYAGSGRPPRPLEGIPVAVKEEAPIEGQRNTLGSLALRDNVADHTAVFVRRILDAGGIVHARSTTPEFSCAPVTWSRLWGVTRNPWNTAYAPGGSSGGSGASLASGSTTLATGSDIGGSIRIPASFCGVVGFKPPYGRVPEVEIFNLDHYCHEGPLARTVADCALLENVDAEVVSNTLAAAERLRDAGAIVEEVTLPWDLATIGRAARIHFGMIFGPSVRGLYEQHADELTSYARRFVEEGDEIPKEAFVEGLELEA